MPSTATYPPSEGRLFFAILWNPEKISKATLMGELNNLGGPIRDMYSPDYYPMAKYYSQEMGTPLLRRFVLMEGMFSRNSLIEMKQNSMQIERETSNEYQRAVNIDPGLICPEQLLLISTKPYAHRVYIGENLYVELCYTFSHGHYHSLAWTYPDYANEDAKQVFEQWREGHCLS